jgi:hypothetical protein
LNDSVSPQSAYSTRSLYNVNVRSSNNKANTVVSELKQFAIALKILRKYPDAFNEFKTALSRANGSIPEEVCKDR